MTGKKVTKKKPAKKQVAKKAEVTKVKKKVVAKKKYVKPLKVKKQPAKKVASKTEIIKKPVGKVVAETPVIYPVLENTTPAIPEIESSIVGGVIGAAISVTRVARSIAFNAVYHALEIPRTAVRYATETIKAKAS